MGRALIGWELGAGRGHLVSMMSMAEALQRNGHEVALAVQRFEAFPARAPAGVRVFQAPVWPAMLNGHTSGPWQPVTTQIDILARLGMDRPRTLKHMLLAWDAIITSFAPQLVIGDYAPALILAAQDRIPTIATGPGFQVPPSDIDPPPRIGGTEPGYDEAAILDIADADLRETGRPPLDTLSGFFRCSKRLIASFHELDPFGRSDGADFVAPALGSWCAPAKERGEEIFAYLNGPMQQMDGLWRGLAATGRPVRVHLPVIDDALKSMIEAHGVIVERQPIAWPLIAKRSRIAVNHGAHGTMCALMLAGIPQLCLPADLEKRMHSDALTKQGLGGLLDPDATTPEALTAEVNALYDDAAMAARCRAAAPGFARRAAKPFEESFIKAAEALLSAS